MTTRKAIADLEAREHVQRPAGTIFRAIRAFGVAMPDGSVARMEQGDVVPLATWNVLDAVRQRRMLDCHYVRAESVALGD